MARESFTIDLRFDGGREVERTLKDLGDTGERSMSRLSQSSQPARQGLRAVDDVSRQLRGSVDQLADRLGPLGGVMRNLGPAGAAAAAGIAAATAGLGVLAQRAPDATRRFAEIGEQADQLDVTVQALQELRFAASQAGVEEDRLEDGLQELQGRLGELRNEAGPLANTLEEMGARGLRRALLEAENTDEALQAVIRTLQDSDDSFNDAALAAAAFGDDSGRAIRRLAEQDLPELRQEFRDLGIAIDEDLVRQSQEARGELSELDQRIQNNVDVISTEMIPAVNAGKEAWADFTGAVRDAIEALKETGGLDRFLAPSGLPGISLFNITGLPGELFSGSNGQGGDRDPAAGLSPQTRINETLEFSRLVFAGQGGAPSVPTPGTKPDAPDGFGGGSGGGTADRLSFAGIDFNDPFTMNDAIQETIALNQEAGEASRATQERLSDLANTIRDQVAGATGDYARELTDLNRAFEAGAIDQETYRQRADQLADEFSNQEDAANGLNRAVDQLGFTFSSAFEDAIIEGESLRSVLQGVAEDIARIALRQTVTQPLGNAFADFVGGISFGDIFGSGGTTGGAAVATSAGGLGQPLPTFADGGSFTVGAGFPGINAGRDNRLVQFAARDGERVDVQPPGAGRTEVNVINQSGGEVETRRSRKGNGGERVDVLVKEPVKNGIAQGEFDNAMQARFGLRPRKAGR